MNSLTDSPALQSTIASLLDDILLRVDQPAEFPGFATQKFLQLTAAGAAVMVECVQVQDHRSHRIIAIVPKNATSPAEHSAIHKLIDLLHIQSDIQIWNPEITGPHSAPLKELGVGLTVAIPLIAGSWRAGGVLLFDLPDSEQIKDVLPVVKTIAPIIALALRSALLAESQGAALDTRSKLLQHHRKSLRAFFDNKLVGMVQVDIAGNYVELNQQWENMTGYSRTELLGKTFQNLTHPDELREQLLLDKIIANKDKQTYQIEKRYIRKDGSVFWGNLSTTGLYDDEDQLVGMVGMISDITEERQAKKAQEESEQKYRTLLDNQKNAVFLHKFQAEGFTCFSEVNAYAIEHYGYSREEFLNLSPADITVQAGVKKYGHTDARKKLIELGHQEIETFHIKKSGEQFPVEISTTVISLQGEKYILSTVKDISERKSLEAQLRQKYKMEAVGLMAGGMAHNFNNNLAIILGNIELAQLKQPDNSDVIPLLQNAKTAILRSRDLIQNILTYSREGTHNKLSIQLLPVIDETFKLLKSTIPATVKLQQLIDDNSRHVMIKADSSQIQEALINLCNNAMHAMDEKGMLQILLNIVELQPQDIPAQYDCVPGPYARLSVLDDGSGMSPETIDKIFDPFFTTKAVDEGTGMGLSTVQGIVRQHGGLIKVISTLGEGTTFELYFPLIETPHPGAKPVATDLPEGDEKILFIDDEELLANIWGEVLGEYGYRVRTMTNSAEALKLFSANPGFFDLVITDQTMPDLSGRELIKELLTIRPSLPTILCTGYSTQINAKEAQQLGITAFCMKPLDLSELLQTTRRVLDEK